MGRRLGEPDHVVGRVRVGQEIAVKVSALEATSFLGRVSEAGQDRANTLAIDNSRIGRLAQVAFSGLKVTEMREGEPWQPLTAVHIFGLLFATLLSLILLPVLYFIFCAKLR